MLPVSITHIDNIHNVYVFFLKEYFIFIMGHSLFQIFSYLVILVVTKCLDNTVIYGLIVAILVCREKT